MDIVEELRINRESGAKRLESEYKAGLMTLARRFCADAGDAEELVNRTFAVVVERIDDYLEQSAFFAWMCQILTHLHSEDTRRKSNRTVFYPGVVPDNPDEAAEERIFTDVDSSILRDAVEELPNEMREAVVLHYFAGLTVPQIARFVRLPVGTVKSRLHYARKALAAKLSAKVDETVKIPGVKALLIALLFFALVAAGAVAISGALRLSGPSGLSAASRLSEGCDSQPINGQTDQLTNGQTNQPTDQPTNGQTVQRSNGPTVQRTSSQLSNRQTVKPSNQQEQDPDMNKATLKSTLAATSAAASLFAATTMAATADIYVATAAGGGNDANPGTEEAPFLTLSTAVTEANAAIDGGAASATIHVAPGTYDVGAYSTVVTIDKPITVLGNAADPSQVVLVNNSETHRAFNLSSGAALKGLTIARTSDSGTAGTGKGHLSITANALVEDCVVSNGLLGNASSPAYTMGGNVVMNGGTLRRCKIVDGRGLNSVIGTYYACGNIYVLNSDYDVLIENCLIAGGYATANYSGSSSHSAGNIFVHQDCKKAVNIVNCTIAGGRNGYVKGIQSDYAGISVVNSVIYGNGGAKVSEWANKQKNRFFNCAFSSAASYDGTTSSVKNLTDTFFADVESGDYRPRTSHSPVVNAGSSWDAYTQTYHASSTTDLAGGARLYGSSLDIGCYEYQGADICRKVYITPDADGTGNGKSWASPMRIYDYLKGSGNIQDGDFVLLKAGRYNLGDPDVATQVAFGNKNLTFSGGYAGTDDTTLAAGNSISQFILWNRPTSQPCSMFSCNGAAGYKVVFERISIWGGSSAPIYKTNAGTLCLTDCTIVSNGWRSAKMVNNIDGGRGIHAEGGSLFMTNCVVEYNGRHNYPTADNYYASHGFGIYLGNITAELVDCTFRGNGARIADEITDYYEINATIRDAGRGMGLYATGSTKLTAIGCDFVCNKSTMGYYGSSAERGRGEGQGGSVVLDGVTVSGSSFRNCSFVANQNVRNYNYGRYNTWFGGALNVSLSNPAHEVNVENCTFAYNITDSDHASAGLDVWKGVVNVRNTIFVGNHKLAGNDAAADIMVRTGAVVNVSHTLLPGTGEWNVKEETIGSDSGTLNLSNVMVGDAMLASATLASTNLIETYTKRIQSANLTCLRYALPTVYEAVAFDVHLRSKAGRWTAAGYVADTEWSPAIDAGDPSAPTRGEPKPNGGRINLGRFGGTAQASLSKRIGLIILMR